MAYKSEAFVSQVRRAREAAGISQRALSERTGLTQSHISQIESGRVEPGLSSFIDMLRALDLELMLVPKKFVSAVKSIASLPTTFEEGRASKAARTKRTNSLLKGLASLTARLRDPEEISRTKEYLAYVKTANFGDEELDRLDNLVAQLSAVPDDEELKPAVNELIDSLKRLRNVVAHQVSPEPRPAYDLDNDDA